MIHVAALCIGLGVWPEPLYDLLPAPVEYVPYTAYHVVEMLQLLLFSGLAFFVMLPLMRRTLTISLDVDWIYRRLGPILVGACITAFDKTKAAMAAHAQRQMDRAIAYVERHHGPEGYFARTWPTGSMVALVAMVLVASLAFYLA